MDVKRMRLEEIFSQKNLDLKIYQNLQIAKCIDENFINRLLESTRSVMPRDFQFQLEEQRLERQLEERRVEDRAINSAISSFGLQKAQMLNIYSDEDSSSDENLFYLRPSTSSASNPSSSSSASCSHPSSYFETQPNQVEVEEETGIDSIIEAAMDAAVENIGLRKNT